MESDKKTIKKLNEKIIKQNQTIGELKTRMYRLENKMDTLLNRLTDQQTMKLSICDTCKRTVQITTEETHCKHCNSELTIKQVQVVPISLFNIV